MMNKLDQIGKIINWAVFAYLILISVLTLTSKITYGHGLGDLIFLILSSAFAIIHLLILVIFIHARQGPVETGIGFLIAILFLLVAIAFTYKFTLGRGPENRWRGNVFETKNEVKVDVLARTPNPSTTGPASPHRAVAMGREREVF